MDLRFCEGITPTFTMAANAKVRCFATSFGGTISIGTGAELYISGSGDCTATIAGAGNATFDGNVNFKGSLGNMGQTLITTTSNFILAKTGSLSCPTVVLRGFLRFQETHTLGSGIYIKRESCCPGTLLFDGVSGGSTTIEGAVDAGFNCTFLNSGVVNFNSGNLVSFKDLSFVQGGTLGGTSSVEVTGQFLNNTVNGLCNVPSLTVKSGGSALINSNVTVKNLTNNSQNFTINGLIYCTSGFVFY